MSRVVHKKNNLYYRNKENLSEVGSFKQKNNETFDKYYQISNISYPFVSFQLSRDPLDNPSFNFIDPLICTQPYLTETTILDMVMPCLSPLGNFFVNNDKKNPHKVEQKQKKEEDSHDLKNNLYEINEKIQLRHERNLVFADEIHEQPVCLLNGTVVHLNEKSLFENNNIKNSGYFENKLCLQDFEIGKPLGKGRYGSVFLVRHKLTKTLYALKMVNKEKAKEEKVFHLIQREALIQESLNHPNILKCYGSFEDEKRFYLILEYTPNGSLYDNLSNQKEKKFSEQEASKILFQILSALIYLGHKNIIHRDIKGENIMNCLGVYKLTDFGWSTYIEEQFPRKTMCGTIEFIAPEMIMNENYTQSVDLWALGVLSYELVKGAPPFQSDSNIETFSLILDVNFEIPPGFSIELRDFIAKILVKDPKKRMSLEEAFYHEFIRKYNKEDRNCEMKFNF